VSLGLDEKKGNVEQNRLSQGRESRENGWKGGSHYKRRECSVGSAYANFVRKKTWGELTDIDFTGAGQARGGEKTFERGRKNVCRIEVHRGRKES